MPLIYVFLAIFSYSRIQSTDKYVVLSHKILKARYTEHVKKAIGKPTPQKTEMTIEKLNQLLLEGQISEEIYLTLRSDIEQKELSQTENRCRGQTPQLSGSNYLVP